MSKRSKSKYPALKPKLNLWSRQEFIETEYINGIYGENGEQLIRPLNEEEKEWLNKFYTETVVTSFKQDGTDFYDAAEQRRELWRDNNKRNNCLFSRSRKLDKLVELKVAEYDKLNEEECEYQNIESSLILKEAIIKRSEEIAKEPKNRRAKFNKNRTK